MWLPACPNLDISFLWNFCNGFFVTEIGFVVTVFWIENRKITWKTETEIHCPENH